jgi:transposase-like protein
VDTPGKAYMGVLMAKRKRRSFTPEFKAETVWLVLDGGKSIPEVARELDPRSQRFDSGSTKRRWIVARASLGS